MMSLGAGALKVSRGPNAISRRRGIHGKLQMAKANYTRFSGNPPIVSSFLELAKRFEVNEKVELWF